MRTAIRLFLVASAMVAGLALVASPAGADHRDPLHWRGTTVPKVCSTDVRLPQLVESSTSEWKANGFRRGFEIIQPKGRKVSCMSPSRWAGQINVRFGIPAAPEPYGSASISRDSPTHIRTCRIVLRPGMTNLVTGWALTHNIGHCLGLRNLTYDPNLPSVMSDPQQSNFFPIPSTHDRGVLYAKYDSVHDFPPPPWMTPPIRSLG